VTDRALLWARSGLVWLLLTVSLGLYLGVTGQFGASSFHAHAGLLGGVWAVAFAWLFERRGGPLTGGARVQWALYNGGVATMVVAMFMVQRVGGIWGLVIGIGGLIVIASAIWVVTSVWPRKG
jgi:hypothetical protein